MKRIWILLASLIIISLIGNAQTVTTIDKLDTATANIDLVNWPGHLWKSATGFNQWHTSGDSTITPSTSGTNGQLSISIIDQKYLTDSSWWGFKDMKNAARQDTPNVWGIAWMERNDYPSRGWFIRLIPSEWQTDYVTPQIVKVDTSGGQQTYTVVYSGAYVQLVPGTDSIFGRRYGDTISVWKGLNNKLFQVYRTDAKYDTSYIWVIGAKMANSAVKMDNIMRVRPGSSTPDNTPPTVTMTTPAATNTDTVVQGNSYTIAGTLTDAGSGPLRIDFRTKPTGSSSYSVVGSDASSPYSYSWNTTGIAVGNCDIKLYGYDNAGNFDSTGARTIYIKAPPADVTPPTLTLTITVADSGSNTTFTLRMQDAANDSGAIYVDNVKKLAVRTSSTCTDTTITYTVSNLTVGGHSARGRGKDQAGNAANTLDQSFTINAPTTIAHNVWLYMYKGRFSTSGYDNYGAVWDANTDTSTYYSLYGPRKNYPYPTFTGALIFAANVQSDLTINGAFQSGLQYGYLVDGPFDRVDTISNAMHANGKLSLLTVGSSADYNMPNAISTAVRRTALIVSMMDKFDSFNLDGFDLDTEHGTGGTWGLANADTANYRAFIKELRDSLNTRKQKLNPAKAPVLITSTAWQMAYYVTMQSLFDAINWMSYACYDSWGTAYGTTTQTDAPYSRNAAGQILAHGAGAYTNVEMITDEAKIKQWKALGGDPKKFGVGISPYYEHYSGGTLLGSTTNGISGPYQQWVSPPTYTSYSHEPSGGDVKRFYWDFWDTATVTKAYDTLGKVNYLKIFTADSDPTNERFYSFPDEVAAMNLCNLVKAESVKNIIIFTDAAGRLMPTTRQGVTRTNRQPILWAIYNNLLVTNPVGDVTAPVITSLTVSPNTPTVSGIITISASATDNIGVTGGQFKLDATNIGTEQLTTPFSITYDTRLTTNGPHTVSIVVRDDAGNTNISSVGIAVENAPIEFVPPVVAINSPSNGATVGGSIVVSLTATDQSPFNYVKLFRNDTLFATVADPNGTSPPWTFPWNTVSYQNGTHELKIEAQDSYGNTKADSINITVFNDKTAPTVSITSHNNGDTLKGTVNITASSSDNIGVSGVQFTLSGNDIGIEDVASPFSISFDSKSMQNGSYTLSARSRDAAGNIGTATNKTVIIFNPADSLNQMIRRNSRTPSGPQAGQLREGIGRMSYVPYDTGSCRNAPRPANDRIIHLYPDGIRTYTGYKLFFMNDTLSLPYTFENSSTADSGEIIKLSGSGWRIIDIQAKRTGGTSATINVKANSSDVIAQNYATTTTLTTVGALQNTSLSNGAVLTAALRNVQGTVTRTFIVVILEKVK